MAAPGHIRSTDAERDAAIRHGHPHAFQRSQPVTQAGVVGESDYDLGLHDHRHQSTYQCSNQDGKESRIFTKSKQEQDQHRQQVPKADVVSCLHGLERRTRKKVVSIPGGVDSGTQIRLAGEGQPGINGGPSGNLYLADQNNYAVRWVNQSSGIIDAVPGLSGVVVGAYGVTFDTQGQLYVVDYLSGGAA
jgi:hypothetical protein